MIKSTESLNGIEYADCRLMGSSYTSSKGGYSG
jgi:hypothetical protein